MNVLWCKKSKRVIFNINNCECNREKGKPEFEPNHIWITKKEAEERIQNATNRVANIISGCYHEN